MDSVGKYLKIWTVATGVTQSKGTWECNYESWTMVCQKWQTHATHRLQHRNHQWLQSPPSQTNFTHLPPNTARSNRKKKNCIQCTMPAIQTWSIMARQEVLNNQLSLPNVSLVSSLIKPANLRNTVVALVFSFCVWDNLTHVYLLCVRQPDTP